MTRLAVDRQADEARLVRPRPPIELDLAAVTLLTGNEARLAAEHAQRRPIVAIGNRHLRRDPHPAAPRGCARGAEPRALGPLQLERQHPYAAIRMPPHEALRAATDQVRAADDAHDRITIRAPRPVDDELVLA